MYHSNLLLVLLSLSLSLSASSASPASNVVVSSVPPQGAPESDLSLALSSLSASLSFVQDRTVGEADEEAAVRAAVRTLRGERGCASAGYAASAVDGEGGDEESATCQLFGLQPDDAPLPLSLPAKEVSVASGPAVSQVTSTVSGPTSVALRWAQRGGANVTVSLACPTLRNCTVGTPSCSHYRVALYKSPTLCSAPVEWSEGESGTVSVDFSSDGVVLTSYPIAVGTPTRRLLIVGDIGHATPSHSVATAMAASHAATPASALLIAGDLSYANFDLARWDAWLDLTLAATTLPPLLPAPGNHEMFDLMASYRARFGPTYYSTDLFGGAVHVIVLNAEEVLFTHWQAQFTFLQTDLAAVPASAFVIAMWHQPWYCSNKRHEDSGWEMRDEYESLLGKRANLVVQGHVHAYQRTRPVFRGEVGAGPVYLTVGTGGNGEGLYKGWESPGPSWDAAHDSVYGFGTLDLLNETAVHWRFYDVDQGTVVDEAVIVRQN
jgi:hypothetical protein